jgi:hypothetical protein
LLHSSAAGMMGAAKQTPSGSRKLSEELTRMAKKVDGLSKFFPAEVLQRYEIRNYRNAVQILSTTAKTEFQDLVAALGSFSLTVADIRKPGGNESDIPKKISSILRPGGWLEMRIKGDLVVTKLSGSSLRSLGSPGEEVESDWETLDVDELRRRGVMAERLIRKNFLDGHKVDYVKGRVAFDVEWNSKDQTFDRDLYAFRAFHECDLIDVGVLLTRSADLNEVFEKLGPELDSTGTPRIDPKTKRPKMLKTKYGASTTWMGKLVYRLDAGRQGGCPVLAIGMKRGLITDWKD